MSNEVSENQKLIDFTEIPDDGEIWELFARDFLQEIGFFIESPPDRGPDGGKDLLVTEKLKGNLGNYSFRWLVSCKHFAKSGKSVQEGHEQNILERVEAFNADGFIGFYSTIPASSLNTRLKDLRYNGKIKDYKIFDHKLIENYLIRVGFSELLMRYFPQSYKNVKPLHLIFGDYIPLECPVCEKDLLRSLYTEQRMSIIAFVGEVDWEKQITYVNDVYWACKGNCDDILRQQHGIAYTMMFNEFGDLAIPKTFIEGLFALINNLRDGKSVYSDNAFKKLKYFIAALSQKVLREMTADEKSRAQDVTGAMWF